MNFQKAARPLVMGRNGVVSSGHYLASLAGVKAMEEGGNAVDAALAAAFVMTVVRPETCGCVSLFHPDKKAYPRPDRPGRPALDLDPGLLDPLQNDDHRLLLTSVSG